MSCPSTPRPGSDERQPGRQITASNEGCRPLNAPPYGSENGEDSDPEPGSSESDALASANAQLNKNLQELTQTYRALEDLASAAEATLLFVDTELQVERFTRNTVELFGIRDRDRGRPVGTLAERLHYPLLEADARRVLEDRQSLEREIQGRNGHSYRVSLKPDRAGDDGGVVIRFLDITDKARPDLPMRETRRIVENFSENLHEPVILLSDDLRIQSANQAFHKTFQTKKENIEGESFFALGGGQWDRPDLRDLLERVVPRQRSIQGFELTRELSGVGERTYLLNCRLLDDQPLVLLTFCDITANRQLESLRLREDFLAEEVSVRRRLQEMASVVMQSATTQRMFDHVLTTAIDLVGADFSDLRTLDDDGNLELSALHGLNPKPAQRFWRLSGTAGLCYARAFRERQRIAVENIRLEREYQSCLPLARETGFVAVHSTPLIARSGKLLGVLSTYFRQPRKLASLDAYVTDLLALEVADLCEWWKTEKRLRQSETQLRAQSEQLLANDRQKNQFLGLLGHELRNPLTVMRNSIQTLTAEADAFAFSPRIGDALRLLERQSRHMTHLVNDLLDVTRINNGKVVLKRERVSLPRCLEEVVAAHRSTLVSRELAFSVDEPAAPIYLDADAARLFQVLDNLLTNAIKFTQPGGRIHVATSVEHDSATISVQDSGIGIPTESLESLFDPFTQVDNSLACHGLGLGLSLVRTLVELHGGDIRAYSEGEDKGSEFVIHWPLHQRQTEPAEDAAPPDLQLGTNGSHHRILVVDDMADIADSFAQLLEAAGHEVLTCYDAQQALTLARETRPTVAFLDMIMPDTDGLQLAEQLRREFDPQELTMVVVSGYGQSQDIEKARAAGFKYHLLKPIEMEQVHSLLNSLDTDSQPH